MRLREPYEAARRRWESQAEVGVPEPEIAELVRAEALGVRLDELRRLPWEDVEAQLAWLRGRQIAAMAKRPMADDGAERWPQ